MRKLRRKFPANFSDLLFIGFIAWCSHDLGALITEVYIWKHEVFPDITAIVLIALKFVIGIIISIYRIRYNKRSNG